MHADNNSSPSALSKSTSPKSKFAEAIRTINAPFIYPISAPYYVSQAGVNFTMKGPPIWTEPLGNDLCILDIDNRPFSKENELFNDDHPLRWDSFDKFSAALLNHHLYGTWRSVMDYLLIDSHDPWLQIHFHSNSSRSFGSLHLLGQNSRDD
jgi:hypothetical protein